MIEVSNITKIFPGGVTALQDISFKVGQGEVLGVVGESGCGKSTLLKIALGLLKPDEGRVRFDGKRMGIIFQNPLASLDPLMSVEDSLKEADFLSGNKNKKGFKTRLKETMQDVELPHKYVTKKPYELSGGECQRVAFARAILFEPELLLCDEPVSSLDALVQARILNLFLKLQTERNFSALFVSHDLKVIRHICDRVLVIQKGVLKESGKVGQVFENPQDAYTHQLLLAAGLR